MNQKFDLIKNSPRELLLQTIQEKQAEVEKELAEKNKKDQEKRIKEREKSLARALETKKHKAEERIVSIKRGLVRYLSELADNYFHLNRTAVATMPKEQFKELSELIAYTAKKRLAFQLMFLPISLPLTFLAWALRKADHADAQDFIGLFLIGMITTLIFSLLIGTAGFLASGYKIMAWICFGVGSIPWAMFLSGLVLKLVSKLNLIENFSEKMKNFECLGSLKYLYYRSQAKKELGSAGLVKFLENEARS